jgi:S-adenosylmethionine hydrolase
MIITLTTDFGTSDSYVAQMKGAILAINAQVQVVDVTHAIPPQDVDRAASVLSDVVGVFPAGSIHVVVVDPGVGSSRALLAAEAASQRFLAPDNGLLHPLFRRCPPVRIHRLTENRFWRSPVSATLHGRDILAPVAAHWSLGSDIAEFGPAVDAGQIAVLTREEPHWVEDMLVGRVESTDSFGNLITNIDATELATADRSLVSTSIAARQIIGLCHCYSDQPAGMPLALMGSSGRLEIAVNRGSAAKMLGAGLGMEVRVRFQNTPGEPGS